MKTFDIFISLIFTIKIIFILLTVIYLYLKIKGEDNSKFGKNVFSLKKKIEFIFILLMAILLIYLFNPISNKTNLIDKEAKILLYLFGIILLITSKWSEFIHESKWFKYIQKIM